MRLSGLRWLQRPPRVVGPDATRWLQAGRRAGSAFAAPDLLLSDAADLFSAAAFVAPPLPAATPADISALPTTAVADLPTHDPPLAPRDEASFLLHVAAEIEHALMVQYLYAAYS